MSEAFDIELVIMREVAYKEDSNWGMYGTIPKYNEDYAKIKLNQFGNVGIIGIIPQLNVGGTYRMKVVEVNNSRGISYEVKKIYQDDPTTIENQKSFLGTLMTPMQLDSIYRVYEGADVIQMFKDNTFDFSKVYGMGQYTYDKMREKVLKHLEWMIVINEFPELNYNMISRLMRSYTSAEILISEIKKNPYSLTKISGIGFATADKIALGIGFELDNELRIRSGLFHCIGEAESSGDTYITAEKLFTEAFTLLRVNKKLIKVELDNVDDIVNISGKIALKKTYEAEKFVAETLMRINKAKEPLNFDVEDFIARQEGKYNIKLTDQQRSLFYSIKENGVNFLIGYAGTGKSMLQKLCINLLEELGLSYLLLAPTGKASKVLKNYTKRDAWTIHKATGIGKGREEFMEVKITADFVIVDESSMCDIYLVKTLLEKLANENVRIMFLGDDFQLPSVSCGNVLYDCKESGMLPITKLDIVFRQKEGGILDIVTKIRKGEKFIPSDFVGVKKFGNNCILVSCPQEKMEKGYIHYYKELLQTYGKDGVWVLSPTKKAGLGTHAINRMIQDIVNPKLSDAEPEIKITKDGQEVFFRVNDNVMNVVNSYNMKIYGSDEVVDIMNGDTGVIVYVDQENKSMRIDFDGIVVTVGSSDLDKIIHSYCSTNHKSQGSACKAIISVMDKSHTYQLNANLIYTSLTRPEEFLVILCQADTLNRALKKVESMRRNTFLCELLKEVA